MAEIQITQLLAELAAQLNITQVISFVVMLSVVGVFTMIFRSSQQASKVIDNNNALLAKTLADGSKSDTEWADVVRAVNANNIMNTGMISDAMKMQTAAMDRQGETMRETITVLRQVAEQLVLMESRIGGNTGSIDDIASLMVDNQNMVQSSLAKGFEGVRSSLEQITCDLGLVQERITHYEQVAKERHASVELIAGIQTGQNETVTQQIDGLMKQVFALADAVARIARDNSSHEQNQEASDGS